MARLRWKDRNPPNGWIFKQPQTGWDTAKSGTQHLGFDTNVQAIINHRKANPRFSLSTNPDAVAWELEQFTIKRIQGMKGAQQFLIGDPVSELEFPKLVPPLRKSGAAAGAEKVKAGASLVVDWLGDGLQPVAVELATTRARTCSGCPHNEPPGFFGKVLAAAARSVSLLIEAREEMKLYTEYDDRLHQCQICSCDLKLKVFAPLAHVLSGTTMDEMGKFPDFCWVKTELGTPE